MSATTIKFNQTLTSCDPHYEPVLIIGQLRHLTLLKYEDLLPKFGHRVSEENFKNGVNCLHPSPTDTCSLYLDLVSIAALPLTTSRHNTTARSHAITRLVRSKSLNISESIVLVCEKKDVFASACAVIRAFPLYSRKSLSDNSVTTVSIEFIIIDDCNVLTSGQITSDDIACLEEAARSIRMAARIVDTPCNEMNVNDFINEVKKVCSELSLTPTIIQGEELKARGFGGIYGVGKAASVPPALVCISHEPQGANETIAVVGKGIVYDTGGLSIKGKLAMPGMKRDCGGAAAILGFFYAAVKRGFKDNLHVVFCLAENSVGPNSTRPDDIHTLYSGRTVEINNTDAEGRLVLADGVVYAHKDLKANIILDMATLTGAQGIATGKYHGAILTNSEEWEYKSLDAGRRSGDLLFPLVYCPELHFSEFSSTVADMKNSVADRSNAQPSCAGLFIAAHLGFDFTGVWIHVDMATPVQSGERATGYGVALLLSLFGNHTNCPMLRSIAPAEFEPPQKRTRV